ncbi:MAG: PPOX class F420-dependent oxidoreductase [Thaumarchaeota archaeon]|nr:PPOX class F420-dependent oxidoreductase [Nitrososphaerota archaeon]
MAKLSKEAVRMIEGKNFTHLATLMPDGSPQVTPVWVDYDNGFILVNTTKERIKYRNVKRDPRIALSIIDSDDPYTMLAIRGKVVKIITKGTDEHIEKLSMKYMGKKFPWKRPRQKRVVLKIKPEHVMFD